MFNVSVSLFGEYRKYAPEPEFEMELEAGASVMTVIEKLRIPKTPSLWALVDGKREKIEKRLEPGSKLFLFQPVGGG